MTGRHPDEERILREYRCGYCGARPFCPCRSGSGVKRSYSHAWRFRTATHEGRLPLKEEP
jgi:hypothetical protein